MGNPIEGIFEDRELFADFFTRYYTDCEPESALVAEDEETGEIVGYVTGCMRHRYHGWKRLELLVTRTIPKALFRYLTGRYGKESRHFLHWVVFRSIRETPPAPRESAHFHINLLPAYRTGVAGRKLVFTFFKLTKERGVRRLYGQIQTRDDRRTSFWTRYGFREHSRRRITKFERHDTQPIYVTTVFRDVENG